MQNQALVAWIVIGLVAGVLGGWMLGGKFVRYAIAGMLGGLVAGWAVMALGIGVPIGDFWIRQVVVAAAGAVVVILAARTLS